MTLNGIAFSVNAPDRNRSVCLRYAKVARLKYSCRVVAKHAQEWIATVLSTPPDTDFQVLLPMCFELTPWMVVPSPS
jgi:hypothetical protein